MKGDYKMRKKYYHLDNNLSIDANYRVLLSGRNVGKSYALKEYVVKQAYESNFEKRFVYLRRHDSNITESQCNRYFCDMPISNLTNGDFDGVAYYRGYFYFTKMDAKTFKQERGPVIGYGIALNNAEHYKSLVYSGVENMIYEEFITGNIYLPDEPRALQELVSTVAHESDINVWLVGNKIDRACPYFTEWELTNALSQKPGTIDVYTCTHHSADGTEGKTIVTVEQCEPAGSTMFFGAASKPVI